MPEFRKSRCTLLPALFVLGLLAFSACKDKPTRIRDVPEFNAGNSFSLLEQQVAFGPRVPGTEAHAKCLTMLKDSLQACGAQVNLQSFEHYIDKSREKVQLTNIIASFNPGNKNRMLLAAHWDSRPWADAEIDSAKHSIPVDGANDGASGVAVLLQIAQNLRAKPAPIGVDILFFDGEDFGTHGNDATWAIGSQHFARHKDVRYNPFMGILLDMVGDKDLHFLKEGYSVQLAPDIVNLVWNYAARLQLPAFTNSYMGAVTDDHVALLKVGIPCIDIIDFDYKHWHTVEDTPDKCSPESLGQVGRLLLELIYDPPI
ncbi:MAG: M28 family peptidase [Deferribacteres bacterium]|nr:M28 family peptidase [candidate division KSB1 bacterium]MCB9503009.1 M28 family peptidase [Deferribacteres bacterium]